MSYAQQQRNPRRHLVGIASVVLLHIVIVYALVNGLARKAVDILKGPLEVSLIEEHKPSPPPKAPPPPKYVPPPEVVVETPPPPEVVVETPPPPAPVVKAEPPAAVSIGLACPNHASVRSNVQYPEQAAKRGLSGDVLVEFVVGPSGEIDNVIIVKSSNSLFNAAATSAIGKFKCIGQGQSVRVRVPFVFRLDS